ncbi:HYR domain-containing protein [Corallococcus sp. AB018]|nr:HYR domain-containing protein [Corallococcus sp. AB018]
MVPGMSSLGLRLFAVLAAVGALIGVGGCEEAKEKPFSPVTQSARLLDPPQYAAEFLGDLWPGDTDSSPMTLTEANGLLYFSAGLFPDFHAPWRSDGTVNGTVRLLPPYPRPELSLHEVASFTAVNGTVFFTAGDADTSNQDVELWKTDGTAMGTSRVRNLHPSDSSYPEQLTAVGNTLFFTADDGVYGRRLWKSDGTTAGTVLVQPQKPPTMQEPGCLTNFNGTLFFVADSSTYGLALWKSNGTANGTVVVRTLNEENFGDFIPTPDLACAVIGNRLYFEGPKPSGGRALWRSDGTAAGTVRIKDITSRGADNRLGVFTNVHGTLFFTAQDRSLVALWKSDGTAEGTVEVSLFPASREEDRPQSLTVVGNLLFFTRRTGAGVRELWKSDGSESGTQRVMVIRRGSSVQERVSLAAFQGLLYFTAEDETSGAELWRTDGTEAGTVRAVDLWPGAASSAPSSLRVVRDALYFAANDGVSGRELWRSDGTLAGTVQMRNISTFKKSSAPSFGVALNGVLYFDAEDGPHGRELWRTDGTPAGTALVKDLLPGQKRGMPTQLTPMGGLLYFTALDAAGSSLLWKSDGTESGTMQVLNSFPEGGRDVANLRRLGNLLLFTASERIGGRELWRSDGTEAGTVRVKDIDPVAQSIPPLPGLAILKDHVYFTASEGTSGYELWKSDGTEAGTVRVKDIAVGSGSSTPIDISTVGEQLFFFANDGVTGSELWKSDGTEAGTMRVKDIWPGTASSRTPDWGQFVDVDGVAFFMANDGSSGTELWRSDGTEEGTVRVKDLSPGSASSTISASNLKVYQGQLFFGFFDGQQGNELWRTDGSEAGTVCVKDLVPGVGGSYPSNFVVVGGTLLFTTLSGQGRTTIWQSDGTSTGTQPFARGGEWSNPGQLAQLGDDLIFVAYDGLHGSEVWRLPRVIDQTPPRLTCPASLVAEATSAQGATVDYPLVTATDERGETPTLRYSQESGTPFPLGTTSVVVTAADAVGNSATCSFTVDVWDTTPPELTCPVDVSTWATANDGATVEYPDAIATDTVSAATLEYSHATGTRFGLGLTKVTVVATDAAGNSSSCAFQVQVAETPAPAITCPVDIQAEAIAATGAPVHYPEASATGTGGVSVTYSSASDSVFPLGDTLVTATARDERGRTASCAFTVTVRDTTPPQVGCPGDLVAEAEGPDGASVPFLLVNPRDAVTPFPSVTSSASAGARFPLGTTEVTVTATDAASNAATCAFSITVRDTTPPELSCPSDVVIKTGSDEGTVVTFPEAVARDAVTPVVPVTYSHASGSGFPRGATVVTATAQDASGLSASCTFQVTVAYFVPPPAGGEVTTGCACSAEASGGGGGAAWFALLGSALWLQRRSRREC